MPVHQFHPDMASDSAFVTGALVHLVVGNRGRWMDPRRTPFHIVALVPHTGHFVIEIDDFEDRGARLEIPFERLTSYQIAAGSAEASPADIEEFAAIVPRFDRRLQVPCVSYLTSRPSRDVVVAGRQQITHRWWEVRRADFDLVVSQVVLDEIRAGDPEAAARRLELVAGLPLLDVTPEVAEFAAHLIARVPLPEQASADAAHIAVAACHRVDVVLTWNVAHIANAILRRRVEDICRAAGVRGAHLVHAGRIDGGLQWVNQLGRRQRRCRIRSSLKFERHVRRCGPRPAVTFENTVAEREKNRLTPVIL